jgi:hypothetical protein
VIELVDKQFWIPIPWFACNLAMLHGEANILVDFVVHSGGQCCLHQGTNIAWLLIAWYNALQPLGNSSQN